MADHYMPHMPEGTIATVTWPIPESSEAALGMVPPISTATSVPISWELDGVRWFSFCSRGVLREVV